MVNKQQPPDSTGSTQKLWDGRFQEATDAFVEAFTESVSFDRRLAEVDIRGSIAHATMLSKVNVLTNKEAEAIITGLEAIANEIIEGAFTWSTALEDVHMNIEQALTERIGDVGKKLHTGRSRNDQVATDIRLYLRQVCDRVIDQLKALQLGIIGLAEAEADTIMPGFTHLQVAQPVTFGHHLMAWQSMLERDRARFVDCRKRINVLPLGSAALAGTSYPIDREFTRELLEFDSISTNSLDAVSDRDFAIEFAAAASLTMMHLSRWSEELILWTSAQFDFVSLPDRFCTGSSIMPQKKNPDVAELTRGKTSRVYGDLTALLVLMKGQPMAYNRDNQEDKEPLFDVVDTLMSVLIAFTDMVPALVAKKDNMRKAAATGFSTATDLADYLVRKGIPFRDAHGIVGALVAQAENQGVDLADLPLQTLQTASQVIEQDVFDYLTLSGSVNARNHPGGTAPTQVRAAVTAARQRLQ
ncbi:MAG: argininosuccinate lyase [Gammaproteobacteria bacterium]|uniref:Argininosuccinate lyase n=1 Tax=OM182 bacterium MED-G24 TaxID=1986255 RepID=A0A2A5WXS6_9GAMM|nr:argininosuccinate lyase [Gammaproteobacteria bacterium]PDH41098.1 MAG: argininosuccinate lyase [OM182 bacterium MED-G24]RPG27269.1 MAG: argininosuccinate lyase [Gammaproteobacteria bacterium TMED50]